MQFKAKIKYTPSTLLQRNRLIPSLNGSSSLPTTQKEILEQTQPTYTPIYRMSSEKQSSTKLLNGTPNRMEPPPLLKSGFESNNNLPSQQSAFQFARTASPNKTWMSSNPYERAEISRFKPITLESSLDAQSDVKQTQSQRDKSYSQLSSLGLNRIQSYEVKPLLPDQIKSSNSLQQAKSPTSQNQLSGDDENKKISEIVDSATKGFKDKNDKLEVQSRQHFEQIILFKGMNDNLKKQLVNLKLELRDIKQDNNLKQGKIKDLSYRNIELSSKLSKNQVTLDALNSKLIKIQWQNQNKIKLIQSSHQQIVNGWIAKINDATQLAKAQEQVKFQQRLKIIQKQNFELKLKIIDTSNHHEQNFNSTTSQLLQKHHSEKQTMLRQIQELKQQLQLLTNLMSRQVVQITARKDEATKLIREIQKLDKQNRDVKKQNQNIINQKQLQLNTFNQQKIEMELEIKKLKDELTQFKIQIQKLTSIYKQQKSQLIQKCVQKEQQNKIIKTLLNNKNQELAKNRQQLIQKNNDMILKLKDKEEELIKNTRKFQQQIKTKQSIIEKTKLYNQQKNQTQQKNIQKLKIKERQINQLIIQIQKINEINQSLSRQLQISKQTQLLMKNDLDNLIAANTSMNSDLAMLSQANIFLNNELQACRRANESYQIVEQDNNVLKSQLMTLTQSSSYLNKMILSLESQKNNYNNQLSTLQDNIKKISQQKNNILLQKMKLEKQVIQNQSQKQQLQSINAALILQKSKFNIQKDKLVAANKIIEKQMKQVQQNMIQLKEQKNKNQANSQKIKQQFITEVKQKDKLRLQIKIQQQKNIQLEQQIVQLQKQKVILQNELQTQKKKHQQLQQQNVAFRKIKQQLLTEKQLLKKNNQQFQIQIKQLAATNKSTEQNNKIIKKQYQHMKDIYAALKKQFDDSELMKQTLYLRIQQLQTEGSAMMSQLQALQDQLITQRNQNQYQHGKIINLNDQENEEKLIAAIEQSKKQINKLIGQLQAAKVSDNQLKQKLSQTNCVNQKIIEESEILKEKISHLELQLKTLKITFTLQEKQFISLKKSNHSLQDLISSLKSTMSMMEKPVCSNQQTNTGLDQQQDQQYQLKMDSQYYQQGQQQAEQTSQNFKQKNALRDQLQAKELEMILQQTQVTALKQNQQQILKQLEQKEEYINELQFALESKIKDLNISEEGFQQISQKFQDLLQINEGLYSKLQQIEATEQQFNQSIWQKIANFAVILQKNQSYRQELELQNRVLTSDFEEIREKCIGYEKRIEWMQEVARQLDLNIHETNEDILKVQVEYINFKFESKFKTIDQLNQHQMLDQTHNGEVSRLKTEEEIDIIVQNQKFQVIDREELKAEIPLEEKIQTNNPNENKVSQNQISLFEQEQQMQPELSSEDAKIDDEQDTFSKQMICQHQSSDQKFLQDNVEQLQTQDQIVKISPLKCQQMAQQIRNQIEDGINQYNLEQSPQSNDGKLQYKIQHNQYPIINPITVELTNQQEKNLTSTPTKIKQNEIEQQLMESVLQDIIKQIAIEQYSNKKLAKYNQETDTLIKFENQSQIIQDLPYKVRVCEVSEEEDFGQLQEKEDMQIDPQLTAERMHFDNNLCVSQTQQNKGFSSCKSQSIEENSLSHESEQADQQSNSDCQQIDFSKSEQEVQQPKSESNK